MALGFDPKDARYQQSLAQMPTFDDQSAGVQQMPAYPPAMKPLSIRGVGNIGVNQFAVPPAPTTALAATTAVNNYAPGEAPYSMDPQYNDRGARSLGGTPPGAGIPVQPKITELGGGIVRRGSSFSNMGVAGLDDIDNKNGTQLPSVAGFLKSVKNYVPNTLDGGPVGQGVHGVAPPDPYGHILNQATNLLQSDGLVDNWRGRLLMRLYDRSSATRVAQQEADARTQMANIAGGHLANEMPIHQMANAAAMYGHQSQFAVHAGQAGAGVEALKALKAGDPAAAHEIMGPFIPRWPSNPVQPHVTTTPTGQVMVFPPNGGAPSVYDPMELMKQTQQNEATAKKGGGMPRPAN